MHILYVCTGNICRSPTAERLTRAYAEACLPDPSQLTTASAGTQAVVGSSMHPTAEMVLLGLGGQGSGFRAGLLEEWQVAEADLVLTMSRKQRRTVLGGSPRALSRTFTLREAHALMQGIPYAPLPDASDLTRRGQALVAALARQRASRVSLDPRVDDIIDPIGRDQQTFLRVGNDIATPLLDLLAVLCGTEEWDEEDDYRRMGVSPANASS
ncbi:MAG: protein tyrosine phosphatase [Geodermatophilaceae bacterium]|nr:protein tyrosine phosphatase [Geodermatophilaceae bacterium]